MSTVNPVLQRISQIAVVVRDAEGSARRCWDDFGIGPWTFYRLGPDVVSDMVIRSQKVEHAMLTAHCPIGGLDWELIQPLDSRSVYAEHLRTRGEGLHHILFDVNQYQSTRNDLLDKQYEEIVSGNYAGCPYSYFDLGRALGCLVEIWAPPADMRTLPPPERAFP